MIFSRVSHRYIIYFHSARYIFIFQRVLDSHDVNLISDMDRIFSWFSLIFNKHDIRAYNRMWKCKYNIVYPSLVWNSIKINIIRVFVYHILLSNKLIPSSFIISLLQVDRGFLCMCKKFEGKLGKYMRITYKGIEIYKKYAKLDTCFSICDKWNKWLFWFHCSLRS